MMSYVIIQDATDKRAIIKTMFGFITVAFIIT